MDSSDSKPASAARRDDLLAQGWKQRDSMGFGASIGPFFVKRDDRGWSHAFIAEDRHLNAAGIVHGGMLMTLLDQTISAIAFHATGNSPCVTVQMDTQFMGAVPRGKLVQARGRLVRKTRTLVFLQGEVTVDGEVCTTTTGIMKILSSRRESGQPAADAG